MHSAELIRQYLAGPKLLRQAVSGMSEEQLRARPVPGKWSTAEVVCHIADFEPIYADRMKRVIAETEPKLLSGDPELFAARLAYDARDIEEELQLIEIVRNQMFRIFHSLRAEDFQRCGIHSTDGPLTLFTLLERISGHIPHHVRFVEEKRRALGMPAGV